MAIDSRVSQVYGRLHDSVGRVIQGQSVTIRHLLAALASGGHVLLEDFPGTGKTTLAKALARSIDARFTRVQFTPDLLPADILGVSIYHQQAQERIRPLPMPPCRASTDSPRRSTRRSHCVSP